MSIVQNVRTYMREDSEIAEMFRLSEKNPQGIPHVLSGPAQVLTRYCNPTEPVLSLRRMVAFVGEG